MTNQDCQNFGAFLLQQVLPPILNVYGWDQDPQKIISHLSTTIPGFDAGMFKNLSTNDRFWQGIGTQVARYYASQYEPGRLKSAV